MLNQEVVKVVKGYAITRTPNTHHYYYVTLKSGENWRSFKTFRTIKAAAEYIEKFC